MKDKLRKKNCFSVIFRYDDDLDEVEEEDHFEDVDDLEVKKKNSGILVLLYFKTFSCIWHISSSS